MEPKAAPHEYRAFLDSRVWQDIKAEMEEMRRGVRDSLETVSEQAEIFRFQGRAEVLRDLVSLPRVMLESIEEAAEKGADQGQELPDDEDLR